MIKADNVLKKNVGNIKSINLKCYRYKLNIVLICSKPLILIKEIDYFHVFDTSDKILLC